MNFLEAIDISKKREKNLTAIFRSMFSVITALIYEITTLPSY